MPGVSQHVCLRIYPILGGSWWVALGYNRREIGEIQGLIRINNTKTGESRLKPGTAYNVVREELYGRKKPLLIVAGTKHCGGSSYRARHCLDGPSLKPLPIVAVATRKTACIFGASHWSLLILDIARPVEALEDVLGRGQHPSSGAITSPICAACVYQPKYLIGWVRQVLKNDTLASGIAIRTRLPGADDVIISDMYGGFSSLAPQEQDGVDMNGQ
ncbi:hypothetical protein FRC03_007207 [Tulasnella sp. 419]|nr:hypothetical protein FRC03_007207 [Tulasnella sp. 419]